jgi:hypothetical protein
MHSFLRQGFLAFSQRSEKTHVYTLPLRTLVRIRARDCRGRRSRVLRNGNPFLKTANPEKPG